MGGVGVTKQTLNDCFECKTRDGYIAWGINIPKLNIYNDQYRVVHLGYGINPTSQTPAILGLQGVPVVLIGKTADVINAPGAVYRSEVQTDIVLSHLLKSLEVLEHGFIFANVQQADLAGHEQNALKYAKCLKLVDEALPEIVQNLRPDDLLIITGDHGNDPTIGHSNHTREQTPLIMLSQQIKPHDFGVRETLADIGATISSFFNAPHPESGISLLST
jgi:phosphopentomutase